MNNCQFNDVITELKLINSNKNAYLPNQNLFQYGDIYIYRVSTIVSTYTIVFPFCISLTVHAVEIVESYSDIFCYSIYYLTLFDYH